MSNHMFFGDPLIPTSLREISKPDFAKIKTVILSATIVEELPERGRGFFRFSTARGKGEIVAQCKGGYVYIHDLKWEEKAWT